MKCVTCKRAPTSAYSIYLENRVTKNATKDDLVEIVGPKVLDYLPEDAYVCLNCKEMVKDVAKNKQKLSQVLLNTRKSKYPVNYGQYWEFCGRKTPNDLHQAVVNSPYTPSLTPASTVGYSGNFVESDVDLLANSSNRKRPPSSRSTGSRFDNEEVARYLDGNRGRRASTASVLSRRSLMSRSSKLPKLKFDRNGKLESRAMRSVSRLIEFYCPECSLLIDELNSFTSHMILDHAYKAFYKCYLCDTSYLNEGHLKMHEKIHYDSYIICPICGSVFDNISSFRSHTDQHILYSIPCNYCDLSFLSKIDWKTHVSRVHRGRSKRILTRKTHKTLEKFQYSLDLESPPNGQTDYRALSFNLKKNQNERLFQDKDTVDLRLNPGEPVAVIPKWTSLGDDLYDSDSSLDDDISSDPTDDGSHSSIWNNSDHTSNDNSSESELDFNSQRSSFSKNKSPIEDQPGEVKRMVNGLASPSSRTSQCSQELFTDEDYRQFFGSDVSNDASLHNEQASDKEESKERTCSNRPVSRNSEDNTPPPN